MYCFRSSMLSSKLAVDIEPVPVLSRHRLFIQAGDPRAGRTLQYPLLEVLQDPLRRDSLDLDAAVRQVAHLARDPQFPRRVAGEPAEADPLYAALDPPADANALFSAHSSIRAGRAGGRRRPPHPRAAVPRRAPTCGRRPASGA